MPTIPAVIAPFSVAILATGDELVRGDTMNSNSLEISKRLFQQGINIRTHIVSSDEESEISKNISYLLQHHQAIIITGGLGPTSDDITRYALAHALGRGLIFDEGSWQAICDRLLRFGYKTPPVSNRRQAEFPSGALIIPNPNGTAAGCRVSHGAQTIFMLPGPPDECLPMFESAVLPCLIEQNYPQTQYYKKWLLFGVSEAKIAEELDALAKPYECQTGYRLQFPYLEFKIHSNNEDHFNTLCHAITQTISTLIIDDGTSIASEALIRWLTGNSTAISITDNATGGLLEATIKHPGTRSNLIFSHNSTLPNNIVIDGLTEYWDRLTSSTHTSLNIEIVFKQEVENFHLTLPFRGEKVRKHAVEIICLHIYNFLKMRL